MKQIGIALVLGLVAALLVVILLGWFSPGQNELRAEKAQIAIQQTRELAPLWLAVKRVLLVALGVLALAVASWALASAIAALFSVPNFIRMTWLRSWLVAPKRNALYPALAEPNGEGHIRILPPVNESTAQRTAALVGGNVDRFGGSAVRQILRQDDPQAMLPAPEQAADVPLDDVLKFDPQTSPHWLCVGDTGSGKSTAIYAIVNHMRRELGAEFIILEREAQDWNDQAAAVTVPGYLEALEKIEAERQRRAALLREADVDHISKLPTPPSYLCVVLEEAESVYKAMQLVGRHQSTRYMALVRDLASMGRKQGILLIVATQTGTSDVFDVPTRKNLGHKLFFRNEPAVGDSWGIPREIGISRLPTGTAYSLNHGALVSFPQQRRPKLPLSPLYRERRPEELLRLPADAEADGLGANDQPSTVAEEVSQPLQPTQPLQPAPRGVFETVATVAQLPKRLPTPVEAAAMRMHYKRTKSQTAVCHRFYGYKDGDIWEYTGMALRGEI